MSLLSGAGSPLCVTPGQNLFDNPQEWAYFQRFCTYTVEQLSGLRESEFWSRVVLQAAQAEPSIRHAATAIGALDMMAISERGGAEFAKLRKQFAYREYQKAIVGVRSRLASKDCDIRTRLIACVLFACFEAYHGNCETALTQIFAGVEMMEEHAKRIKESNKIPNSPGLQPVDHEFLQSFAMLEIQACSWGDQRSSDLHYERMLNCAAAVANMPDEFDGIKEAGYMLSMITLWGIHLRLSHRKLENILAPSFVRPTPFLESPAIVDLNRVLASFKRWSKAFEPLYRKARSPQGQHLFEAATLLRLHLVGTLLWAASGSPNIGLYYRRYTKELKETLSLSKTLLRLVAEGTFSFDMRVILPLAVVGLNYRHRAVRREIISVLANMDRREAIWDASMMGKVMYWMAEIEEEELEDEEYVPEDGMARILNLKVDEPRRTVFISCSKGIRGVPGETVMMETTLRW
jgi:hypothetical protein